MMSNEIIISNTLGFSVRSDEMSSLYREDYSFALQTAIAHLIANGSGGTVFIHAPLIRNTGSDFKYSIKLESYVQIDGLNNFLDVGSESIDFPVFSAENVHDCSVRNLNIIIDVSSKEIRHAPVFALTSRASASEEDASEPAEVAYCRH